MEDIENSFDSQFAKINNLRWLPWVGKKYTSNEFKLLIVGESHYLDKVPDEKFNEKYLEVSNRKMFTRQIIKEIPIDKNQNNNTFENLHRAFFGTNNIDRSEFWSRVCFYNFAQRLLDYRHNERPNIHDFTLGWDVFIEVIKILQPTHCIFIGVGASNFFNQSMSSLNVNYTQVEWLDRISRTYPRSASVNINYPLNLLFIQHTSQYFSWFKWNDFIRKRYKNLITDFEKYVFVDKKTGIEIDKEYEGIEETKLNIPTWLSHKPIIACDYHKYSNVDDDAKFLSIGRAQYNQQSASIKLFRHNGNKWSRQSEEVPIERVGDFTLMLLSTINKIQNNSSDKSILDEEFIAEGDFEFLKDEIQNKKERIKTSLLEIKELLDKIDIQKI